MISERNQCPIVYPGKEENLQWKTYLNVKKQFIPAIGEKKSSNLFKSDNRMWSGRCEGCFYFPALCRYKT